MVSFSKGAYGIGWCYLTSVHFSEQLINIFDQEWSLSSLCCNSESLWVWQEFVLTLGFLRF